MTSRRYQVTLSGLRLLKGEVEVERIGWLDSERLARCDFGPGAGFRRRLHVVLRLQRRAIRRALANGCYDRTLRCTSGRMRLLAAGFYAALVLLTCSLQLAAAWPRMQPEDPAVAAQLPPLFWPMVNAIWGVAVLMQPLLLVLVPLGMFGQVLFVNLGPDPISELRFTSRGVLTTRRSGTEELLPWRALVAFRPRFVLEFVDELGARRRIALRLDHRRRLGPLTDVLCESLPGALPDRTTVRRRTRNAMLRILLLGLLGEGAFWVLRRQFGLTLPIGAAIGFSAVFSTIFVLAARTESVRSRRGGRSSGVCGRLPHTGRNIGSSASWAGTGRRFEIGSGPARTLQHR